MCQKLAISLILAGFCLPVSADFESASREYRNRNYNLAFEQFSQLADEGDARAQAVIAIMYRYGESVPLDLEQTFHWYLKSAEQGYPSAQFHVGSMLIAGEGVEQDRQAGINWLQASANAGYEPASDRLSELEGQQAIVHEEKPVTWSQSWNLRLPNEIREEAPPMQNQLQAYRVQVGAMSTITAAERLWGQLQERAPALLSSFQPLYRSGLSGEREVIRVQIGPFEEKSGASRFCGAYHAETGTTGGCLVVLTH